MPRQALERKTRTCERAECGQTFEVRENAADAHKRFCSRSCARLVDNQARSVIKQQEWSESAASLCPCGNGRIPYSARHTTKYCSPTCRMTFGKKKQANPENYITFDCKNCGQSVTRYKNHGKYHKYCSNECASKHTKTRRHLIVEDSTVLDSGWEALFWGLCAFRKIAVDRFQRERGVEWRPGTWYAPDFWMPTYRFAVEVKGVEDSDDAARWAAFRKQSPLVVLGREELSTLCLSQDLAAALVIIIDKQQEEWEPCRT